MTTGQYLLIGAVIYVAVTTALAIAYFFSRERVGTLKADLAALSERFRPIVDVDAEKAAIDAKVKAVGEQHEALLSAVDEQSARLKHLQQAVMAAEFSIELVEVGINPLVFELDSHAAYVEALNANQDAQKAMVAAKTAVIGTSNWTVNGKEGEGRKMVDKAVRLALRAFNNECDVLMGRISWKNLDQIKDRVLKSADAIDKLNTIMNVEVTPAYIKLKLREAELRQQEALKKQEEKEELRRQREEEREEAQAQKEYQAEIRRQERVERERMAALTAARAELSTATAAEQAELNSRIADLEARLTEAQSARARTQSMAELTRVGYVYVISNPGAFGPRMFKVGMTRRLEPLDRIRELGDASVPFPFDVHAMVFTDNAPGLERELHAALSDCRVNRINMRKEFFTADVDRVREVIHERFPGIPFLDQPEGQEYAMSRQMAQAA